MKKDNVVTKVFEDYYYIENDWIYANGGKFIVYRWVEIKGPNNKKYLRLGYTINDDNELIVDIRDLTNGSDVKVL